MSVDESLTRAFLEDSADLLDQSVIKIRNCIEQLTSEQIWWRHHPQANSIGNLLLHICGNLRQWTVAGIAGQPDTRERSAEFSAHGGKSGSQLLELLEQTVAESKQSFKQLGPQELLRNYSIQGFEVSGLQAISHTTSHFAGHTHQIIFITRMQLGDAYRFAWSPDAGRDQVPL